MAVRRFVGLSLLLTALLGVPFLFTSISIRSMGARMTLVGVALGIAAALALHQCSFILRAKYPIPFTFLTGIAGLPLALLAGLVIFAGLTSPPQSLGLGFAFMGGIVWVILLITGGLGALHQRKLGAPWAAVAGGIAAEWVGLVVSITVLAGMRYDIAEVLRNGSRDIPIILDSFQWAGSMVVGYSLSAFAAILALECIRPWFGRARPRQVRALEA